MLRKTCWTGKNIKTETQLNHAPALMQEDFAFPMESKIYVIIASAKKNM